MIDQRATPHVDCAKKFQAHEFNREMPIEPWSTFDARQATFLVKLQRTFTAIPERQLQGIRLEGRDIRSWPIVVGFATDWTLPD